MPSLVSRLPEAQRRERRDRVVAALTVPELAPIVDLVLWVEPSGPCRQPVALAANHLGTVELHPDGSHAVRRGRDPIVSEDPLAFLPYAAELAAASPACSTGNAYPYAAQRVLSFFADPWRSPDVAVVHTPRHFFPETGGHVGEHGSLDVIQSRAPLVLSGRGVRRAGLVDDHCRVVDVAPTLALLAGVPEHDLVDARGEELDGGALTAYLQDLRQGAVMPPEDGPRLVVGLLWDGAHCGDLLDLAAAGELPAVQRLLGAGTALRGGAVAQFPSVTLTNHTSLLTGVGPGRHGVLGNVFYDRETGQQVVPNNAATWHLSAQWLRPGVRTVFEMVSAWLPDAGGPLGRPRTASVNEAIDRGADYSTMELIRRSGTNGADGLAGMLPAAADSVHVRDRRHLRDGYYAWATQVDDAGLQQVLQLWDSAATAPALTWWSTVVTDAGHHAGGPRSAVARDSLREADSRLSAFLRHLDALGVTERVTFLLTADHGFEAALPAVTGSWKAALDQLAVPYRDEGPGFIYLLADG